MSQSSAAIACAPRVSSNENAQNARRKVLIVDDDQFFTRNLERLLRRQGFEVVTLRSALGLSAAVQREQPDLLLVDVAMPAINGDRAAELLRKSGLANCPIVLLSALPNDQLAAASERCQATAYISKVRRAGDILQQIDLILERRCPASGIVAK
ncbi:MAG: response regulator [Polyangiaceae bacterium]|nr:response regulator [Polyangiaceae bacterium]